MNSNYNIKTLSHSRWLPIEDLSFFSKPNKDDFCFTYEELTVYIDVLIVGIAENVHVSEAAVENIFRTKNRAFFRNFYAIFETSTICSSFDYKLLYDAFSKIVLPFSLSQILENNYMYIHLQTMLAAHANDGTKLIEEDVSAESLFDKLMNLSDVEQMNFVQCLNGYSKYYKDV